VNDAQLRKLPWPQQVATNRNVRDRGTRAQRLAEEGDEEGAAAIWAGIFGEPFPAPDGTENDLLSKLYAGAGIDAAGRVTTARPTARTRPWRRHRGWAPSITRS
jgi:hypothetical protein